MLFNINNKRYENLFLSEKFGQVPKNAYLCTQIPKGSRRNAKLGVFQVSAKSLPREAPHLHNVNQLIAQGRHKAPHLFVMLFLFCLFLLVVQRFIKKWNPFFRNSDTVLHFLMCAVSYTNRHFHRTQFI